MSMLAQALVVARRDFLAIVATPTFLLFLLAPLMMVAFGAVGGLSATQLASNASRSERIVALVAPEDVAAFRATDVRMRQLLSGPIGPPLLTVLPQGSGHDAALAAAHRDANVLATLSGPAAAPRIAEREGGAFAGRYLAALADQVVRGGDAAGDEQPATRPVFVQLAARGPGQAARTGLGYAAVFTIFLLTLLLAGQSVGMLAEEKGNKVIEILAAAAPLEAVFFGKLLGMLGVALLFVAFWALILAGGTSAALAQLGPAAGDLATLTPAIGWPLFLLLGLIYFLTAFLLLGAVFLGVGAQASTVREIQMLSLPITFFQIGMFVLASSAANAPGTTIAAVAQWLPWSSPFAMAARGATDAAIWPHVLALGWQALWVAISVWLSARLFRSGVLRSGSLFGGRRAPAPRNSH